MKVTPPTIKTLYIVEPYVTWGFPNLKSVQELILKCGQAKVKSKGPRPHSSSRQHSNWSTWGFDVICRRPHSWNFTSRKNFQWLPGFPAPFPTLNGWSHKNKLLGFIKEVGYPGYWGRAPSAQSSSWTKPSVPSKSAQGSVCFHL